MKVTKQVVSKEQSLCCIIKVVKIVNENSDFQLKSVFILAY
jgi:hypothetical protein